MRPSLALPWLAWRLGTACAGSIISLPLLAALALAFLAFASCLPCLGPFPAFLAAFRALGGLFLASAGWPGLSYGGGLAAALAGLPCWPIKIGCGLACWLASALPFRRLAPWLAGWLRAAYKDRRRPCWLASAGFSMNVLPSAFVRASDLRRPCGCWLH